MNLETATLKELEETQQILQVAHDTTESQGFNVFTYDSCYIGRVRQAAGMWGHPPIHGGGSADRRSENSESVVELHLALSILDNIAKSFLSKATQDRVWSAYKITCTSDAGRYVEKLGCGASHEQPEALEIFREALTVIYREIEERKKNQTTSENHDAHVLKHLPSKPDQRVIATHDVYVGDKA